MTPSLSQVLKDAMAHLPFVAGDLSGIGGVLKAKPEHFQVEEILPYAPCGEGEHLFVLLRRSGWNTVDVARALAKCFGLHQQDVGWGGRKDKHAVATQTFSLRLPLAMSLDKTAGVLKELPFEILKLQRHGNKLKRGHVAGNRFQILLSQVDPEAFGNAQRIAEILNHKGVPNYYGEQRFGIDMKNIDRAAALIQSNRPAKHRKETFTVSVLQSALFNYWLKLRMERGEYETLLHGDVAKKTDTGGLFIVQDLDEAAERFGHRRIVYTGPIFGHKMMEASHQAGEYEAQLIAGFDLTLQSFKALRAPGSRRAALLYPTDMTIQPGETGLLFYFTLPSGAYATTVMREFMRPHRA